MIGLRDMIDTIKLKNIILKKKQKKTLFCRNINWNLDGIFGVN
jgi:hypothetical protein